MALSPGPVIYGQPPDPTGNARWPVSGSGIAIIDNGDGSLTFACTLSPGTTIQSAFVNSDSTGLYVWTYPTPYGAGVVPQVWGQAIGPNPQNGVLLNVQTEGTPTNTAASFRVTRSNVTAVSLLGLSILSIPTSVGVTPIQIFSKAP